MPAAAVSLTAVLTWTGIASIGGAAASSRLKSSRHSERRATVPAGVPGNWKLILDSDFNGSSINRSVWRRGWFGSGTTGPINALEAACYSPANLTFPGNGAMSLSVTHVTSSCAGVIHPYTGAIASTNPDDGRKSGGFQYRYGVFEAKVYVPGKGGRLANWPAIATFGQVWPRDGEDDILEVVDGSACFHFHSPAYAAAGHLGGCDATLTAGWHTFASDWQPGSVTYYYDGAEVGRITKGVTSAPMYIVIVNTVSKKTPWVDQADALRVAYVRVWQGRPDAA